MAHILVVDDDEQIRATLGEFLKKTGYDVALASNGKEALQHLAAHKVDLIVLDVIMPEQDGIGTILEIMKLPVQRLRVYAAA
jgi:two-component system phosphate regulon response regulator OmpR